MCQLFRFKSKGRHYLVAAAAEQHSNHPIAISLSKAAEVFDRSLVHKTKVIQEVAGHGVEAEVDGRKIFVGNRRWMEKNAIKGFVEPDVSHDIAGTIIYVAQGDEYMGAVFISDALREDAKETLQGLRNQGVDRLVMLTGDRREAAEKVANSVGITEAHSELLPQDKVTFMDRILDDSKKKSSSDQSSGVAFVGDGINDAPALALADVGSHGRTWTGRSYLGG